MIKILMQWDIKSGRETAYLDFVSQELTPGLLQLGVEPSEVWYTYWGEGPQILTGLVAEDLNAARKMLADPQWTRLYQQLLEYVVNFQYKLVPASGRFQL
jgi:hypothetical protein